jgi:hypothetical protein
MCKTGARKYTIYMYAESFIVELQRQQEAQLYNRTLQDLFSFLDNKEFTEPFTVIAGPSLELNNVEVELIMKTIPEQLCLFFFRASKKKKSCGTQAS